MSKKHKKRLSIMLLIMSGIGITVTLALTAFSQNMLYFFSPTQVVAGEAPTGRSIRVGGMVNKGSVERASDSLLVKFSVTDYAHTIQVQYTGILPDLFREEQGIVAIGQMQEDGSFIADEVLAKHDENYMPPEVAAALKAAENND
ncbi:MAG: cytochrome c maturation protein CcmE [Gammaproteobacteria bacterium]|nr:MAG: cytochrome c maturation protein CcmE [Gammaproteobacteria bacterium]RKZ45021.1 MAG: cytochrome c maturation protein CcmE [Gammaproteobacteria bacterium]RKZ74066.1 MAG: cytochrome c maturation protein CcmE [Gammaproteobacteria bacterium]